MRFNLGQNIIDFLRGKKRRFKYKIGKNTKILKPSYIDETCEIGNNTYIGMYNNITKSIIGNYCSIGNYVQIGQGEHDITQISTSCSVCSHSLTNGICIIKNDVWIGAQSIIRRGVTIGNGAVVGANSFVNKDIPDFAVVAGNPAKIIKYRFNEETRNKILDSNWWDYELKQSKEIIKKFQGSSNPENALGSKKKGG